MPGGKGEGGRGGGGERRREEEEEEEDSGKDRAGDWEGGLIHTCSIYN